MRALCFGRRIIPVSHASACAGFAIGKERAAQQRTARPHRQEHLCYLRREIRRRIAMNLRWSSPLLKAATLCLLLAGIAPAQTNQKQSSGSKTSSSGKVVLYAAVGGELT